jgi:hypothetical protein
MNDVHDGIKAVIGEHVSPPIVSSEAEARAAAEAAALRNAVRHSRTTGGTLTIRLTDGDKNPYGPGRNGRRRMAAAMRKAAKVKRVRVVLDGRAEMTPGTPGPNRVIVEDLGVEIPASARSVDDLFVRE